MAMFIVAPGFLGDPEVLEYREGEVARSVARFKREDSEDALLIARLLNEHVNGRGEVVD